MSAATRRRSSRRSRPILKILVDEDVPVAIAAFLRARGHDAVRVIERLLPGSADKAVVELANAEGRIVITFNLQDYNRLITRAPRDGHDAFPNAGLIGMQCAHPHGLARVECFIETIEHEFGYLSRTKPEDGRLIVQITETVLKVVR